MTDKLSHLIQLIDNLPEPQAKALLQKLFQENPLVAFKIIARHFGFVDLQYANDAGLKALMERLEPSLLKRALNGSKDRLIRRFTDQMSPQDATEFIDTLYTSRASDAAIKAARNKVLVKAFLLHKKGVLTLRRPGID